MRRPRARVPLLVPAAIPGGPGCRGPGFGRTQTAPRTGAGSGQERDPPTGIPSKSPLPPPKPSLWRERQVRGTRIPASMVRTIAARGRSPAASGRRSSRWQSPGATPSATIGASKALFEASEASVRETNSGRRGVSRQSLEFSLPATPGATKVLTVASEAGARETNPGRCGISRPLLGWTLHSQHLALPKRLHSERSIYLFAGWMHLFGRATP